MSTGMYRSLVEQVAMGLRTLYKLDPQPPATEASLQHLCQRTRDELSAELPDGYLDFLRITDGLNWNGLFVYASDRNPAINTPTIFMQSFVENNLDWRSYEPHNNYLFYAEGDISLYGYNLVEKRYELQDRSSGDIISTFETFDEMITEALKISLHEDGEEEDEE